MTLASTVAIDQAQLVRLFDNWVNANRPKDVDARMANYSENVMVFDVVEPLEYLGVEAVRNRVKEWFSSFQGPIEYEVEDLRIASDGDVAFSHSLNHVKGTKTDGKPLDMWWRSTVCFRKMDDKWMVTHEHNSVPFNVGTGKASVDLRP